MPDSRVRLALVALSSALVMFVGCSRETPPLVPSAAAPSESRALAIVLSPPAMYGGSTMWGRLILREPAPAGGLEIHATSSRADLVWVRPTIIVAAGQNSTNFEMGSRSVSADTRVMITARSENRSVTADLELWTRDAATAFTSFVSMRNGSATAVRAIPENAAFSARYMSNNTVRVQVTGAQSFQLEFSSGDQPFTVRSHTVGFAPERGSLRLDGLGTACSQSSPGVVTIRQVTFSDQENIREFDASYELSCEDATVRGDIRLNASGIPR